MSDDGTERDHEGEMERDKERERRPCRDSYIILMKGSAALDQAEAGPNGNQGIAKYNLKKCFNIKVHILLISSNLSSLSLLFLCHGHFYKRTNSKKSSGQNLQL